MRSAARETDLGESSRAVQKEPFAGGSSIRLCVFGSFYPEFRRAGNSTTGLVSHFAAMENVAHVSVIAQVGARLPPWLDPSRVTVHQSWEPGHSLSIIRATSEMYSHQEDYDAILWNTYMTAFGAGAVVNGVGLCCVAGLSKLSNKPTLAYVHNWFSTQQVSKLGYTPSFATGLIARLLERILLRGPVVVVPLQSQADALSIRFHSIPRVQALPYIEATPAMFEQPPRDELPTGPPKLLVIGNWGPQKDVDGLLHVLSNLLDLDREVSVTIAGAINPNFPEFDLELSRVRSVLGSTHVHYLGELREDDIASVFRSHDVIFLPYRAAGGYSGAMNLAAFFGLGVVAFRVPELEEYDRVLSAGTVFVTPEAPTEASLGLHQELVRAVQRRTTRMGSLTSRKATTVASVQSLVEYLGGNRS